MKLNSDEITEQIQTYLFEYETLAPEVAKLRAEMEKWSDLEESTIAVLASSEEGGSEAEKKRHALRTAKYQKWLESMDSARLEYLTKKARLDYLELALDKYQSLLSFEGKMIIKTT